jgi:hypothetical protein
MLEKLAKLLNQAENAGTSEESAAFMARAQQLSTTHSIDLAKARHITKSKEKTLPIKRTIVIGESGTKGLRTLTDLYLGIAAANDIKCTIAHNATRVYAYGFAEDIDVSEAIFASLQIQQAKFLGEFKTLGEWKSDTVYREGSYKWVRYDTGEITRAVKVTKDYWGYKSAYDKDGNELEQQWVNGGYKPVDWLTARLNFQDAFASRISGRLYAAKREEEHRIIDAEAERAARPHLDEEGLPTDDFVAWMEEEHGIILDDLEDTTGTASELSAMLKDVDDEWTQELIVEFKKVQTSQEDAGTALVLASKKEAVNEFYAPARKAARGSYRGGHSGATANGARGAGHAAGDRARLSGSTAIGGVRGAIGA